MKKIDIEHWIADLRSGNYEQARGAWRREMDQQTAYCCLSVLHEITLKREGTLSLNDGSDASEYDVMTARRTLAKELESFDIDFGVCQLWNDGDRLTFDEIADKLEEIIKCLR